MAVDPPTFRQALSHFPSGVTVVTIADNGLFFGLTVSAFCSLSLTPPRILICIDKNSSNIVSIRNSSAFTVNVLSATQSDISGNFARKSANKFNGISYHIGILGAPILNDVLCSLECKLIQEMDGGDHFIYIGEIEQVEFDENKEPLLYYKGAYGRFH